MLDIQVQKHSRLFTRTYSYLTICLSRTAQESPFQSTPYLAKILVALTRAVTSSPLLALPRLLPSFWDREAGRLPLKTTYSRSREQSTLANGAEMAVSQVHERKSRRLITITTVTIDRAHSRILDDHTRSTTQI